MAQAGRTAGSRRVARDRVISTVDPQARHTRKTSAARRDGYKAHVAAEPARSAAQPAIGTITASGQASFTIRCQRCPLRQRCTTATGGRTIHVHPHEDELRAARRHATTHAFADSYRR